MNKQTLLLLAFGGVASLITSCGSSNNGELVGVQDRKPWYQTEPEGMVFIPQGVLQAGQSDQDVMFNLNNPARTVSVKAFYMDDTEISNNEYRQFVYWVRDSLAHKALDHLVEDESGRERVDWKQKIDYNSAETQQELAALYIPESEQINGYPELDASKLNYKYKFYDFFEAAKRTNFGKPRTQFTKDVAINIYPDTLKSLNIFLIK